MNYEPLESRVLLAATFAAGKLTVTGTPGDDKIMMRKTKGVTSVWITPTSNVNSINATLLGTFSEVKQVVVNAGDGNDQILLSDTINMPTQLYGGNGNDEITGGYGKDVLHGQAGNDTLAGLRNDDALFGGSGNDEIWITRENGNIYAEGQEGNDFIHFTDPYYGVNLALTISKPTTAEPVYFRATAAMHNTTVQTRSIEHFDTTAAGDTISVVIKSGAYDWGKSSDYVNGGIYGGSGGDLISMDIQDDRVRHGFRIYGYSGNDTIDGSNSREYLILDGSDGDDVLRGGRDGDSLFGYTGNDALFGNGGNDSLAGGEGNDYLEGGDGDDLLEGYAGNDALRGGPGIDRLFGNEGDDVFYTRDRLKDHLYGGSGTDSAQRDGSEQILDSIEKTLA